MAVITEEFARKAPLPEHGQKLVFDNKLSGFGLRLTSGSRSWIVQIRAHQKSKRVTIGQVGEMTLAEAKKQALTLKAAGIKGAHGSRPKTVAELWERIKADDANRLRPRRSCSTMATGCTTSSRRSVARRWPG